MSMSANTNTIRRVRRFLAVGVAVAAAAGGLAGCGSDSGSNSDNKTITVQVQAGADKQFAAFIEVFKKQNPGVTVKTTSVAQTAKTGSNLTVLTSANAPDVAIVPTNTQVYSRMIASKQLEPLDDVWKAGDLESGFGKQVASTFKADGTPFVIGYDRTFYNIVYYNKELFSKLGIAEPVDHRVSTDDFIKMAKTLQAGGLQGLSVGAADNYQSSWQVDSFLQGTATPEEYDNYLSSWQAGVNVTAKYTDPAFINAVAAVQNLGKAGVYQDGFLGQKVTQSESLFLQQQAGMLLDGNYSVQVLKDGKLSFDLGWMLLPSANPAVPTKLTLYTGDTLGIPVNATNKPLAKKFLESVMSAEGQASQIQFGILPSVTTVPDSALSGLSSTVQEQVADSKDKGALVGWTSGVPGGLGQQFIEPLMQAMLNGQTTPEDIGAKVQDQLQVTRSGK